MEQETILFQLILDALKSIKDTSIGEGNYGIVVDKFPSKEHFETCAKYHKFQYDGHEYEMLQNAYELGLPVPKPLGEWPKYRVFAMKRVIGGTLKEFTDQGHTFSPDVAESIMDAVKQVCGKLVHGDLAPRNIMLENITVENNTIVDGGVFVIDFGKSQELTSSNRPQFNEWEGVEQWLKRHTTS